MKEQIHTLIESKPFQNFIIALIILNGITLGMETSESIRNEIGTFLLYFDLFALGVFTIEIALKLYVQHLHFFRNPWNVFDFVIVAIAYLATGPLAVLRTLRILRVLRLITVVPQMRMIVSALLAVIPGISSIMMLVGILFYIFAVLTVNLYGETFPQWFGTIGESLYTLFQIMTLESWSMGIVRPIMEVHPQAYIVFLVFILLSTFVVVNLIIAVIVDAMGSVQTSQSQKEVEEIEHHADDLHAELLREIRDLKKQVQVLTEQPKNQ